MNLFFDFETIPGGERLSVDEMKPPGNIKKQESIDKWRKENGPKAVEDEFRKRATCPYKLLVVCLSIAVDDGPIISFHGSEKSIFEQFNDYLGNGGTPEHPMTWDLFSTNWIGWNIRKFDLPIIAQRRGKYNCKHIQTAFPSGQYKGIEDVMEMFTFPARNEMVSMDTACKFYGIEGKGDMDGSKVYDEYLKDNIEGIVHYCEQDVDKVRKLYNYLV